MVLFLAGEGREEVEEEQNKTDAILHVWKIRNADLLDLVNGHVKIEAGALMEPYLN